MLYEFALRALQPRDLSQNAAISRLLSTRAVSIVPPADDPSPAKAVIGLVMLILNIVVGLFTFLMLFYTLHYVFPTLAVVEGDPPPTYILVPTSGKDTKESREAFIVEEAPEPPSEPITSSLGSTFSLLRSIGGFDSLFRGFSCFLANGVFGFVLAIVLASFVPLVFAITGPILISLALNTTWTHIVISAPSDKYFWQRMPRFGLMLRATALPTLLSFAATMFTQKAPIVLARTLLAAQPNPGDPNHAVLVLVLYFALSVFVAAPIHMNLTRVQASLLPEGEETIVPLDSALTLHRAKGREYMSMLEALMTFPRSAWIRVLALYAKIFAITVLTHCAIGALTAAEFFLYSLL